MRVLLFLLVINYASIHGQNTLQLVEEKQPAEASIALVSWLEGHWKGTAFGGVTEEIWSPIDDKSMMFIFRHLINGKVNFYEIGHIKEVDSSLVFELRHFDAKLHAWEEKNEVQQFKFIKHEGNRVYFDGFTFEKVSPNEINIYGLIGNKDGSESEVIFNYKKQ
ncbi:DUF6265 family protein [uncultured Croceitalea sp.]|uniref:DUF6265 family protein n=1 Tax=uncultured Croceitalea sp. TaxID=1798908 RepID=UPI0033064F2E